MTAGDTPKFGLIKLRAGSYLAVSQDQTRLFHLGSYEEQGDAWRKDARGRERPIRGTHWRITMLAEDFTEQYPGVPARAIVTRNESGQIIHIHQEEVGLAEWREIEFMQPTLAVAWQYALEIDWLDEAEGRSRA